MFFKDQATRQSQATANLFARFQEVYVKDDENILENDPIAEQNGYKWLLSNSLKQRAKKPSCDRIDRKTVNGGSRGLAIFPK